ncbi:hypothetical protein AJ80_01259 [Polytolypa hystricis UAMH7299]|uniref:DUF7137 domain-containing protein n=1 Tax=Polytolypa hystricis (strain UAMH7299) TaxID=1447883 RepID=A0A2B7Z1G0_POLH7|nr:hypothetical protein AJ80_01259 [Polytolypa hystricis UAMH7299]
MRSLHHILVLCALFALASFAAASWDFYGAVAAVAQPGPHVRRQDDDTTSSKPTQTSEETATDATITSAPKKTENATEDSTDSETGTNTKDKESGTETGTKTGTETGTTTKKKVTKVDPRLPPGGIQMITPGPFDPQTYIKIGEYATFKWNYTSLKVTPSAIDVVAYCSRNDHTYTIAGNQSFQETGEVTWDTRKHATSVDLLTETYTLMVYDSSKDPSDRPEAGYLAASSQYTFGVYHKQKYDPLDKYTCATCSSASLNRQALGFIVWMATITVLSFTWFVSGLGIFA